MSKTYDKLLSLYNQVGQQGYSIEDFLNHGAWTIDTMKKQWIDAEKRWLAAEKRIKALEKEIRECTRINGERR